jgi:hypothetical protein
MLWLFVAIPVTGVCLVIWSALFGIPGQKKWQKRVAERGRALERVGEQAKLQAGAIVRELKEREEMKPPPGKPRYDQGEGTLYGAKGEDLGM